MIASEWTTVRVRSTADRAAVIRALFELGAEGVQELEGEVVSHLRAIDPARAEAVLRETDPEAAVEFEPTPETDWSSAWRSLLIARRVGALVVTPPWFEAEFAPGERIVIDPGMAFGTGDHETTRGMLRLMPAVVRQGDVVADVGAGSAVLGIAAARLGARHAYCIESDPDAIGNAEANVARNGVADRVSVLEGEASVLLPLVAPVRIVLANIVSTVLVDLLPDIAAALIPDGRAVLSGILIEERNQFREALRSGGWRIDASDAEGLWWSASISRA